MILNGKIIFILYDFMGPVTMFVSQVLSFSLGFVVPYVHVLVRTT